MLNLLKKIEKAKSTLKAFLLVFSLIFINFNANAVDKNKTFQKNKTEVNVKQIDYNHLYKQALNYYKVGDYYSAINLLYQLISYPKNKYYSKSLYLLAKIYIKIGRRTGIKKFLSSALYLLNLYAGTQKKLDWDYFYTKGYLYEIWGFYEVALPYYKFALYKATTKNEEIKTLIALLRTAIQSGKMDTVSAFALKLTMKSILKKNEDEYLFLKGLWLFKQGKYKEAAKYLIKVYKYYETYLIENPQFYYLVAENMYRIGKLDFAKQLFRKIVGVTQDLEIIRKAILRLGDIDIKQKDFHSAFNHYYYLAQDYKGTPEATIAKLKIIALRDNPIIAKKIEKSNDEDLKNPIKFVYLTLIKNRNTRVGRYALADFGLIVLEHRTPFLLKKLNWELSITEADRFSYEEREFLRNLWKEPLLKLDDKEFCQLYKTNPNLFKKTFTEETLIKFAKKLDRCDVKLALDLLNYVASIYKTDKAYLALTEELIKVGKLEEAVKTLQNVKNKNCWYFQLLGAIYILQDKGEQILDILPNLENCKNTKSTLIKIYHLTKRGDLEKAYKLVNLIKDEFVKLYKEDKLARKVLTELVKAALHQENYQMVYQVLKKFVETYKEDCNLKSWYYLAAIRLGKLREVKPQELENCKDNKWAIIAINAYKDALVERRLKK